jgi:hypothetical protein
MINSRRPGLLGRAHLLKLEQLTTRRRALALAAASAKDVLVGAKRNSASESMKQ